MNQPQATEALSNALVPRSAPQFSSDPQAETTALAPIPGKIGNPNGKIPATNFDQTNQLYHPPYDPDVLTGMLHIQHHGSAIQLKANAAAGGFRPSVNNRYFQSWMTWKMTEEAISGLRALAKNDPSGAKEAITEAQAMAKELGGNRTLQKELKAFDSLISYQSVQRAFFDWFHLGNAYFRVIFDNRLNPVQINHKFARMMRRRRSAGFYAELGQTASESVSGGKVKLTNHPKGSVLHIADYSPESSVYGVPAYLGSQTNLVLRRSYDRLLQGFLDAGGHFGHVFMLNIAWSDWDKEKGQSATEEQLKNNIVQAQGMGNGKNFYLNLGGVADSTGKPIPIESLLKIMPLGELADKLKIDSATSQDIRAAILSDHQTPPEVMCIAGDKKVASDLNKVLRLFNGGTIKPPQEAMKTGLNSVLPPELSVDFDAYDP